ncbi:hypothetical protein RSOLAG22IIIB_08492 [Rhizoctonia solani]|uniref:Laminin domain protein n=1 Tax=Rhizoctonia solani TaxID=456999 RepID=A0A0K6FTA2_9AGAM|nr:hypothetical protein RSOLAG22IIIB_08492 [Rhizoctonia solani]
MSSGAISDVNDNHETIPLVPPQLPSFLDNIFNLKPIIGNPTREEVKLVHEAIRALNNFPHTSELNNRELSIELSQYLFDIQMICHRQKYPTSVLPNDMVYDPPTLPYYIPIKLKSVTGPPSNKEIASVHTALRISESFANVPSIFDSDFHAELSQHLFDIQLARHVQRSIVQRAPPAILTPQTAPRRDTSGTDASNIPESHTPPTATSVQVAEPGEAQHPTPFHEAVNQNQNPNNDPHRTTELMIEIRDTLKNVNRVLIGSQNSLARGLNSSLSHYHYRSDSITYDLGGHSLINDHGEVPEAYNLPTFKSPGNRGNVSFAINNLSENELARYLRFYSLGEDMTEEGEELKIKSDMIDDARAALSRRLYLNRR